MSAKIVLSTFIGKNSVAYLYGQKVLPTYMGKNSVAYLFGQK